MASVGNAGLFLFEHRSRQFYVRQAPELDARPRKRLASLDFPKYGMTETIFRICLDYFANRN
jgi:hypothetical protein